MGKARPGTGAARGVTATIAFGLVTIPVRVLTATSPSAGISFHLLHRKDGVRLRQQLVCPEDGDVVSRTEAVKGFEFEKGRFVTFSEAEIRSLDQKATHGIEVQEFVPPASVDPVYFERTDYVAAAEGGDRSFALFVRALAELELAAVAQYAARGKDYLVLLRPVEGRLAMHQLLHADEVRPIRQVPAARTDVKPAELELAKELVGRLAASSFEPTRYRDEVRARIQDLIQRKVRGEAVLEEPARPARAGKVVDLMAALRASLAKPRPSPRPRSLKRAG